MAFVRLLGLHDGLARWILAIGVSLALDTLVAVLMIYSGSWSPEWGLMVMIVISLVGALLQLAGAYRKKSLGVYQLGRTKPSRVAGSLPVVSPSIRLLPKVFTENLRFISMMSVWIFGFVVLALLVLILLESITGGSMLLLALWFLGSAALGSLALFLMIVQG